MNAKKNLMAFILTVSSIALMVICLGLGMVKACAEETERMEREGGGRHAACGALYTAGFTTDNDRSCGTCGLLRETLLGWLSDR